MNSRKYLSIFTLLLVILFIFFSVNFQLLSNYQNTPPGTKYFGTIGYFFDYYQFLSWIKEGVSGKILISSSYIPEVEKPVLLHPFFPLVGFIGAIFGLWPDTAYHLARNINLAIFLGSLYLLAKTIFPTAKLRYVAYLLLLFSTSFPRIVIKGGSIDLQPLIPFWRSFYTFEKFDYPPHHLLADAFFVFIIILIINTIKKKEPIANSRFFQVAIISLFLALLNPATAVFLVGMLGILLVYLFVAAKLKRKEEEIFESFKKLYWVIIVAVLPVLIYNFNIFQSGNPWKYFYLGEKWGRYNVSFLTYIFSLGPLFLIGILSFLFLVRFGLAEKILGLWLILPLVMFPLSGRLLPFSMSRLFALNLYIPAALLTTFFGAQFKIRFKVTMMVKSILFVFLALFLFLGCIFSLQDVFGRRSVNYYNVFLPNELVAAVDYIKSHTRPKSTVLAGENISNLIPAFCDNQVVLGREDVYLNYQKIKNVVNQIYLRETEDWQILTRLKEWRVQYLIFGLDQISYEEFIKKGTIPQLKQVYKAGNISVVEVL